MIQILAFLFFLFCVTLGANELTHNSQQVIPTPFGYMPQQCVHHVPNGAHLEPTTEGVRVHLSSDAKTAGLPPLYVIPEDTICTEHLRTLANKTHHAHPRQWKSTRGLSKDGWLDNAYWLLPSKVVSSWSANYGVPSNPAGGNNQVLYYFIGVENFDINATILQPVLGWFGHLGSWQFTSWNCCPSGQVHYANSINVPSGSTLFGEININTATSTVTSTWNNEHSTLSVATSGRNFDWIDATLETYFVTSCSMYAKGPMTFSDMKLQLSDGSSPTPTWKTTAATECGGSIVVNSPFNIVIHHG